MPSAQSMDQSGNGKHKSGLAASTIEMNEVNTRVRKNAREHAISLQDRVRERAQLQSGEPAAISTTLQTVQFKLRSAMTTMSQGLVERDTDVRLLLLAALAGEHILFIGPPGTAKSELARRLSRITTGSYFERLLTRFSVPEELFGPLSMRALEQDTYVRQIEGYLPTASVAFVDEVFKANSAILNTLLTILNERLFDNGSVREPVPLVCLVGASNELPEGDELDALYDRFLLRKQVGQVSPKSLRQLLQQGIAGSGGISDSGSSTNGSSSTSEPLSLDELAQVRTQALEKVTVPDALLDLVVDLRQYLQQQCEPPLYVSDRRMKKAVDVLRVAAYCNGQSEVTQLDLFLLQHMLWNDPIEQQVIFDWLKGNIQLDLGNMFNTQFQRLYNNVLNKGEPEQVLQEVNELLRVIEEKLVWVELVGDEVGGEEQQGGLWLGQAEQESAVIAVSKEARKAKKNLYELVEQCCTLREVLGVEQEKYMSYIMALALPKQWCKFVKEGDKEDVMKFGTRPAQ